MPPLALDMRGLARYVDSVEGIEAEGAVDLNGLPARVQQIVRLRQAGRSRRQIAEHLGISQKHMQRHFRWAELLLQKGAAGVEQVLREWNEQRMASLPVGFVRAERHLTDVDRLVRQRVPEERLDLLDGDVDPDTLERLREDLPATGIIYVEGADGKPKRVLAQRWWRGSALQHGGLVPRWFNSRLKRRTQPAAA